MPNGRRRLHASRRLERAFSRARGPLSSHVAGTLGLAEDRFAICLLELCWCLWSSLLDLWSFDKTRRWLLPTVLPPGQPLPAQLR